MKSLCAARRAGIEFLSQWRDLAARSGNPERIMLDIAYVALGVFWLALCVGYAALCDRL